MALYALTVANSLVQNCGKTVQREISGRPFLDPLVKLVASKSTHDTLRNRILELIKTWADAFKGDHSMGFMVDTYHSLRSQGFQFPSNNASPPEDYRPPNPDKTKEEEELQLAVN